ncbi:MAG: PP2C family protein-serine/threonine phosphatase [Actinomycetota bacterium]|nr:PP2C family protein-serine/threonine phosphatase [Actinomycetota bacterium]
MTALARLATRVLRAPEPTLVIDVRDTLAAELGLAGTRLLLLDHSESQLRDLETGVPVTPTAAERVALLDGRSIDHAALGHLVPLRSADQTIGALALERPPGPDAADDIVALAALLGRHLDGSRTTSDAVEAVRRRRQMSVAAEMQWAMLPARATSSSACRLAGLLEPAYEIAGDAFDHAVSDAVADVAILDAMGHGQSATLCVTLAVAALRNARREGGDLVEQAASVNRSLWEEFGGTRFVTAALLRITGDGVEAVNAGHPSMWRVRGSEARSLELPADLPLGLEPTSSPRRHVVDAEAGDRLVLLTDGVTDARPDTGGAWGEHRLATTLAELADQPPVLAVRALVDRVIDHRAAPLADDATVVCVDLGPSEAPTTRFDRGRTG